MADNRFLIIIPTRNRANLAQNAVRSVLQNRHSNFTLVVSDNSSDEHEARLLSEFCNQTKDPELKYIRPDTSLQMSEHWDWAMRTALTISEPTHVIFLTDRMVFKRNALEDIERVASIYPDKIFSYYWDSIDDRQTPVELNQLAYTEGLFEISAEYLLSESAELRFVFALPKVLNSCVPIDILERVRAQHGRYFDSVAPDFNFAYSSLDLEESVLYYDKALLISYGVARSNGMNQVKGVLGKDTKDFMEMINNRDVCFESPFPTFLSGTNAILHEYHFAKERAVSDKFGDINRKAYINSLFGDILNYENKVLKREGLKRMYAELGSEAFRLHAKNRLHVRTRYLNFVERLKGSTEILEPLTKNTMFNSVEGAIEFANESPRKKAGRGEFLGVKLGSRAGDAAVVKEIIFQ